jgi:NAD(P)-dependent dehydrogenase (short-subunit alcohol dehydrogenase family)
MGLLDGRVAVVTGAGRGLGRSHALALADEGAMVVVNDVGAGVGGGGSDAAVADGVAAEITALGGQAAADHADVSTMEGAAAVVERAVDAFGRVDVVVNNAGVSRLVPIVELDEDVLDLHLGVHLRATIGTTKAAFPAMSAGGRIVNTVSGAGLDPRHPGTAAYAAAKAAVYATTLVAAVEGAALGITVNAVSPLAVTRMSDDFFSRAQPEARADLDPGRVSPVVVYLASDLSGGLTGRVLRVEGGHVSEARMSWSTGVSSDAWTPAGLAGRMGEILGA